jgi:hypothetical protein
LNNSDESIPSSLRKNGPVSKATTDSFAGLALLIRLFSAPGILEIGGFLSIGIITHFGSSDGCWTG